MLFKKNLLSSKPLGTQAELWAQMYLEQQGLVTIAQNFRIKQGEIDLIMRDDEILVFVEVRLRSAGSYGNAKESIHRRKQQRLIKAAKFYLQSKNLWNQVACRFDAICLDSTPDNSAQYQVEWLRDAFSAE